MADVDPDMPGDLLQGERWPYPWHYYPLRVLWKLVHMTVWKVCWKRVAFLRPMILRLFGAKIGGPMNVHASTWVHMPWLLKTAPCVSLGPRVTLYNLGPLEIGEQTILSQDVYVCGGTHDYTDPAYPLIRTPITIGSFVWIGAGAFIGPGVKIGDGAVIGARAVVIKDVEPWTIVAGNPARVIKKREMKRPVRSLMGQPPSSAAPVPARDAKDTTP